MIDEEKRKSVAKRAFLECSGGEASLWAFGNEPQMKLAELTKSLVNMISVVDAYDTDQLIQECLCQSKIQSKAHRIKELTLIG